jgi:hypothetical protein
VIEPLTRRRLLHAQRPDPTIPGCCSLVMRALSLLMMGQLDRAEAESAKALGLSAIFAATQKAR